MKALKYFVLVYYALITAQYSQSCELRNNSSWFWTENQLIEKAQFVFRAKAIKETVDSNSGATAYEFEIIHVIKAPPLLDFKMAQTFRLENMFSSKVEWKYDQSKGRSVYGKDCTIKANFRINSEYIVFAEYKDSKYIPTFHPKSLEELTSAKAWYSKITRYNRKR